MSSLEDFVISRRGADYVLYAGLLAEAHRQGLTSIRTALLQAPSPANGHLAICSAEVQTTRGTFTALGEARRPAAAGMHFAPAGATRQFTTTTIEAAFNNRLIPLAETRAKARALRDALCAAPTPIDDQDIHTAAV